MRLTTDTLDALRDAAHEGRAFPTDVLRLVDEVLWYRNRVRTLEETTMLPDTDRLVEFENALRRCAGDDLPSVLRDVAVATIRNTYARTPDLTLPQALAWLAVQLWRDVQTTRSDYYKLLHESKTPPDDDTGEFVAVASIVATTARKVVGCRLVEAKDWSGRRLVPTTDPADGANVVVTDRGVMRYDPPVVVGSGLWATGTNPDPTVKKSLRNVAKQIRRDTRDLGLINYGTPPAPTTPPIQRLSYMYTVPGPNERFESSPDGSVGAYYCKVCGDGLHGYNDGTKGGSASSWSTFGKCRCTSGGGPVGRMKMTVTDHSTPPDGLPAVVSSNEPDPDAPTVVRS